MDIKKLINESPLPIPASHTINTRLTREERSSLLTGATRVITPIHRGESPRPKRPEDIISSTGWEYALAATRDKRPTKRPACKSGLPILSNCQPAKNFSSVSVKKCADAAAPAVAMVHPSLSVVYRGKKLIKKELLVNSARKRTARRAESSVLNSGNIFLEDNMPVVEGCSDTIPFLSILLLLSLK